MKTFINRVAIIIILLSSACNEAFLDLNRNKKMVVPNSIEDYQALLDYATIMNTGAGYTLAETSTDDYYVPSDMWEQMSSASAKNAYIWNADIYEGEQGYDWNRAYSRVMYANTVIEGLEKLQDKESQSWRNVKGAALFYRSYAFYLLSTLFSETYKTETASMDLGIPLRLSSDISIKYERATVEESYNRIIDDLKRAALILPLKSDLKIRPTKAAAHGILARCYLQMNDYENAFLYADSSFKASGDLMDYNEIDVTAPYPFPRYNKEVIFSDVSAITTPISRTHLNVDSGLYNAYDDLDLRKTGFFYVYAENLTFKGSYDGSNNFFVGLTAGEMLLIRAETRARLGDNDNALVDLNLLRKNRYIANEYEAIVINNQEELIERILLEKRKELIFRGVRWTELKRLNKDVKTTKILIRQIKDRTYELHPNDKRYVFPIPDDAVSLGGIEQNER